MKVVILESEHWNASKINKGTIKKLVKEYAKEAEGILNTPKNLNIIIKPNLPHISTTKGVGGSTYDHELIDITLDPELPFGLEDFKRYLKEAIFHEMNHALYMKNNPREDRQLYWTIMEGLGIVFDTEYANGVHFEKGEATDKEKIAWLNKYNKVDICYWDAPNDGMMYQVGAWVIRMAEKKTGKNVIELTNLSCDEILELSGIK